MTILNIIKARDLYPGWTCIVFIDDTVPKDTSRKLRLAGAEVILVTDKALLSGVIRGMFWRFLVFDIDPNIEAFIVRDVDSMISKREKLAVDAWLMSGRGFHIMRDNPYHWVFILGGMWGARKGALPSRYKLAVGYDRSRKGLDQDFLRDHVWPIAQHSVLQHDAFLCKHFQGAVPFPAPRDGLVFVGDPTCNVTTGQCRDLDLSYFSPPECRPIANAARG